MDGVSSSSKSAPAQSRIAKHEARWNKLKAIIEHSFTVENMKLKDLVKYMKEVHSFHAVYGSPLLNAYTSGATFDRVS